MNDPSRPGPLELRNCWIIPLATGRSAGSLGALRRAVAEVPVESLIFHVVGGLLRPPSERREFVNDFANWALDSLRDPALAERLALAAPDHGDAERLRGELLRTLDSVDPDRMALPAHVPFHFMEGQMVSYPSGTLVRRPSELASAAREAAPDCLFHHAVDARWRNPDGVDDFSLWLEGFPGTEALRAWIGDLDFRFLSLANLRERLVALCEAVEEGAVR